MAGSGTASLFPSYWRSHNLGQPLFDRLQIGFKLSPRGEWLGKTSPLIWQAQPLLPSFPMSVASGSIIDNGEVYHFQGHQAESPDFGSLWPNNVMLDYLV